MIRLLFLTLFTISFVFAENEKMDSFETRRDVVLKKELAKPLKKPRFIKYHDLDLSRPYATSTMGFALKHLYANDKVKEANAAIIQLRKYYKDHPDDIGYEHDSMNWIGCHMFRVYMLFNHNSKYFPGRLSKKAETALLELMWEWGSKISKVEKASLKNGGAWYIEESENHDAQRDMPSWGFSKIFKDLLEYKNRRYDDGFYAQQHYAAWTEYLKEYLSERAKKGLFVENASPGYLKHTLKGIYDLYDFSNDKILKKLAGNLLDLWWACWAQQQINGVRGGAKFRCYPGAWSDLASGDGIYPLAWLYFGIGKFPKPDDFNILFMTSSYRPPEIVADIAKNTDERGKYVIIQRKMGLAKHGFYRPADYRLKTDAGGIVCYSYCTPDFIMGSFFIDSLPNTSWVMISSQNRWQGIIFKDHPDMRIYPQVKAFKDKRTYNPFWSVQYKGAMIVHKLETCLGGTDMCVKFSEINRTNIIEENGWVFAKTKNAYTAVRPLIWSYSWESDDKKEWIKCEDHLSPVVIQVADKNDYKDFKSFRNAVKACPVTIVKKAPMARLKDEKVVYKTLSGDTLTLYTDYRKLPEVNGKPMNLTPPYTFYSPFVQEKWDSGIVTIQNGNKKLVLNFNY